MYTIQHKKRRYLHPFGAGTHHGNDPGEPLTPAFILRSCFIDFGLVSYPIRSNAVTVPVPCYVCSMPDMPNELVCLRDSIGRMFGRGARTGKMCVYPGVIVVVRSSDEVNGYLRANAIASALDTQNFPITTVAPDDGSIYHLMNIRRTTPIVSLGEEVGKKRFLWTINVELVLAYDDPSLG